MNQSAILLSAETDSSEREQTLNNREMNALLSLMSYATYTHGYQTSKICSMLEMQFGVSNIYEIPSRDYDAAINYLIGLTDTNKTVN